MRRVRAALALGVLLAAFGALLGCGQRGPLTLPASARPTETKKPPAATAAPSPEAPTDAAQRPEDEERREKE
jgi:predicted small lipoprotein YifL